MATATSSTTGEKRSSVAIATGLPPGVDADPEEKARYVYESHAIQNDHYVGFYRTWTKAMNFLAGEHWRQIWDGVNMVWTARRDVPPWAQQPVTNLCYRVYRAALAKFTKQKPTLEVVPASGSSEDKEAAELSDALLVYQWRELKVPRKLPTVLGWMLIAGTGFVRVHWDPRAGERRPRTVPMRRPKPMLTDAMTAGTPGTPQQPGSLEMEDVDVAVDENGEPYRKPNPVEGQDPTDYDREPDVEPIGDICWDVESPLAIRVNPDAPSYEDAREMYISKLWPRTIAAKHFGIAEEELKATGDSTDNRAIYENLMSATAAGFPRSWTDKDSPWGVSQEQAKGDLVLVTEYFHREDDEYPEGRYFVAAGDVYLWPPSGRKLATGAAVEDTHFPNGEAPLPDGFWPPLVPFADTPLPGQPTALGLMPQVVPLNEQLNNIDASITEKQNVDMVGGIWIIAPADQETFHPTSEPGQTQVSVAMGQRGAGFAPFQAELKPMSPAIYAERGVMTNKVMTVSGLQSLDRAEKPAGTSGRALLVDQETSDSEFMPTLFSIEAALEECGRRQLVLAQRHYREERTISVRTQDGKYLFKSFTNADLRSGHDVRVGVGSSFPWGKAAQWNTKLDILQSPIGAALITDPKTGKPDKQAIAKYLDSGTPGLGAFESDEDPDLIEIQREHAMFEEYNPTSSGGSRQVPQIAFWQNHVVHLQSHFDFMKKDFVRFQKWSPQAQSAFEQHMQLTLATIQAAAQQMAGAGPVGPQPGVSETADQPGPGGPGGGGGGPALQLVKGAGDDGQMTPQLTPTDYAAAGGQ